MSNFAILRAKKRSLAEGRAMARHALRECVVSNADPERKSANTVLGAKTVREFMAAVAQKTPAKIRSNAVRIVELFIGASPEAMHAMSREQQDAYFKRALKWVGERFGGHDNVVSAVIHRDEDTPHMQVLLVPVLNGKLNARAMFGNRDDMSRMQTEFAEKCGKPHGLRRGEEGSKAKHTSIRQFYKAIQAAGSPEALPKRMVVPPPLPEPGFLSSKAEKAAYERREAERKKAIQANKARQEKIEELARVGLLHHGSETRMLSKRLGESRDELASVESERAKKQDELKRIRRASLEGAQELEMLQRNVEVLKKQASELRVQIEPQAQQKRPEQTQVSRPGGMRPRV